MVAATLLLEGRASRDRPMGEKLWAGRGSGAVAVARSADGAVALRHQDIQLRSDPGLVNPGEAFRLIYRNGVHGSGGLEVRSLDRPGVAGMAKGHTKVPLLSDHFIPAEPVLQAFGGLAALANHDAPLSDEPGLETGTRVMTQAGPVSVELLAPGDVVFTNEGTKAIVSSVQKREAVTLGSMNAVRLRAPYFGLSQDAVIARTTPIMLSGPEVDYMFGTGRVTAQAGDLINGVSILRDLAEPLRDFIAVELDRPACLCVGRASIAAVEDAACRKIDRIAAQSLLAAAEDVRSLIG